MIFEFDDDFDLQKIADSGQCFRCADIGGAYRFITGHEVVYITPRGEGSFEVSADKEKWDRIWAPYFDLDRSYAIIRRMADDDFMRSAAGAGEGIRILKQDPWETLVTFIISQRKSIPAIKKSVEALCAACGELITTDRESLYVFPDAHAVAALSTDELAACALGYRVPYIRDAALKVSKGEICLDKLSSCDDDELFEELKTIKGVGNKVASCVMLFAYARTAFAPVDTWISKVLEGQYGGRNVFADYGENAGIMQQYVFYYAQKNKAAVRNL